MAIRGLLIALIVAFPPLAWGQYGSSINSSSTSGPYGWQVRPALTVGQSYTDNVSLSPKGTERSELTTRVVPSVAVVGNTARLRFNATYSPEVLYRTNQETTDFSHSLNAVGNAELLSRTLFLDLRAGISQQNVSLLAPQSDSNINTTNNRTTVRTLGISPYIRHDFGVNAFGELRYTHDVVHQGGNRSATSSSTSDRIDAKIASGPAYKLFVWSANASLSKVDYSATGQEVEAQNYSVTGGRLITPDLRINATLGYDDSGYPSSSGQDLKGKSWSIGAEWTPTERSRIAGTYGRRYFGPSRSINISHRMRQTFFAVDYNEGVTTTRANFTNPALFLEPANITTFCQNPTNRLPGMSQAECVSAITSRFTLPVDFLTDSLFLERRLQAQSGIQGVQNTVVASFFLSKRRSFATTTSTGVLGISLGDFASSQNVNQTGGSLSWSSRFSPSLAGNATLNFTRNSFSQTNRSDRLTTIRLGLTKEFHPKMTGTLNVARLKNDSDGQTTSYDENSISATLNMRF